jgi:hypothetical protein
MRRVIASRLTASKQTVPHYYLTSELKMDALLAARAQLNAELPPEGKLSVNDFLIRAAALACKRVPEVNSSWLGDVIRTYDYVDISLAVAVPSGLITPIVRDAHVKGLSAINRCARVEGLFCPGCVCVLEAQASCAHPTTLSPLHTHATPPPHTSLRLAAMSRR